MHRELQKCCTSKYAVWDIVYIFNIIYCKLWHHSLEAKIFLDFAYELQKKISYYIAKNNWVSYWLQYNKKDDSVTLERTAFSIHIWKTESCRNVERRTTRWKSQLEALVMLEKFSNDTSDTSKTFRSTIIDEHNRTSSALGKETWRYTQHTGGRHNTHSFLSSVPLVSLEALLDPASDLPLTDLTLSLIIDLRSSLYPLNIRYQRRLHNSKQ